MKKAILLISLSLTTVSNAAPFCGKVESITSTVKMVTVDKKYSITRPEKTIETMVNLVKPDTTTFSYAITSDQLPLALEALHYQNQYELCFEGDAYHLSNPGYADPMALAMTLRKTGK